MVTLSILPAKIQISVIALPIARTLSKKLHFSLKHIYDKSYFIT